MKRLTIKFAIIFISFFVGIATATVWVGEPIRHLTEDVYFPSGAFAPHEDGKNWKVKYYSDILTAMRETSLSNLYKSDIEVYRLVLVPSFSPPVSVRLWRDGDKRYMSVKQLANTGTVTNGKFSYPKTLKVNNTHLVTTEDWEKFQNLLRNADFWSLPTEDRKRGLDGVTFLLEGYKPHQYHVVDRWCPEDEDFLNACGYFLDPSEVKLGY